MILYLRGRPRMAMRGGEVGAFLFGCTLFGVFSVRNTTQGILLIGASFCVVVYWIKPQLMVWVALFVPFAALPVGLPPGKVIGPVSIYGHHVAVVLAICYLIPIVRPRLSEFVLPGMFLFTVTWYTVVGFAMGHTPAAVVHEATTLIEVTLGFVLAMLIVRADYVRESTQAMAVTLWFSAGMITASSLHLIRLAGRTETIGAAADAAEATRVITTTLQPTIATLAALVSAQIICRVPFTTFLALVPPALVIVLLAFSRNILICMGVAAVVAVVASMGWHALRRIARLAAIGAVIVAVTVPGALFLLQRSAVGAWLGDQFATFNHRVFGGISSDALAQDSSLQARLAEDENLRSAIARAPAFGHGLGYAYQQATGEQAVATDAFNTWAATVGTTYSHNFYLWWLCKAGAAGMAVFAVFALTPVVWALRCASSPAKISAAVSAGLLVMSIVDPLPEEPVTAMTLGMALGASMAYAGLGRRSQDTSRVDAAPVLAGGPR